ncbi:MAG: peptide chain release factor 2, partial [Niabella sp.]|nr:peptide chain release factor 2 [Niabella sp.]
DNQRATDILKTLKTNEYWMDLFHKADASVEDFAVLFDFWKAGDATEEETQEAYDSALGILDDVEFKSTLNEPE